jgi:hypothetical protein
VSVQRYRKDLLSSKRKRRLDAIGFVWDARAYLWEQNFAALLKFKRREGHCCVPTFHKEGDLKLGWWVATQRRNKKDMSAERRSRLNKIGFVWHVGFTGVSPRLLTDQVRRAFAKAPSDIHRDPSRLVCAKQLGGPSAAPVHSHNRRSSAPDRWRHTR